MRRGDPGPPLARTTPGDAPGRTDPRDQCGASQPPSPPPPPESRERPHRGGPTAPSLIYGARPRQASRGVPTAQARVPPRPSDYAVVDAPDVGGARWLAVSPGSALGMAK